MRSRLLIQNFCKPTTPPSPHSSLKKFSLLDGWLRISTISRSTKSLIPIPFICRRHPRSVHGPAAPVRVRRVPARVQLPVPGGLRGPGEAVAGGHLPAAGLQDQVPGELLPPEGQPRVRQHQQNLRLLRWMWVLCSAKYSMTFISRIPTTLKGLHWIQLRSLTLLGVQGPDSIENLASVLAWKMAWDSILILRYVQTSYILTFHKCNFGLRYFPQLNPDPVH